MEECAFRNYMQPYECWYRGDSETAPEVARAIKQWLLGSCGANRLTDSYDPNYFRMATYFGPMDIEHLLSNYGRCTIQFDCAPQCFLKVGEFKIDFEKPGSLQNPTGFAALPLIAVYGTGAGTVTVGNATVQIHDMEDILILDCELQDAYRQVGDGAPESMNRNIYAPKFPELVAGTNAVRWTGCITKVEVIPRWWAI